MRAPKTLVEIAEKNGSIEQMNRLLSAAHLLACLSNSYVEEANELLELNGLCVGSIKNEHKKFIRAADNYFGEFTKVILTEKSKMDMFSDMEEFEKFFRDWAKIPAGFKPKAKEEHE